MAEAVKPTGHHINMQPQKDIFPLREQVERFVKGNIVKASYKRIVCGDGRYTKEQSAGGLRMFGGDMGALAAIWKVGKDADPSYFTPTDENIRRVIEAYQKVKEVILGTEEFGSVASDEARKLYIHTDAHAHGGKSGCGHINNMATNDVLAANYHVPNADIEAIYKFITNKDNGIVHEELPLGGDHAEKTVIKVHGPKTGGKAEYTLNSFDGSEMHFVVDEDRVNEYFNRLSTALHMTGITAESLQKSYSDQETTTAIKLAPGYQVVHVYITDQDTFNVDFNEDQKVPHSQRS
jgi:hypothetical protein